MERLDRRGGRAALAGAFLFLLLAAVTFPGVVLVANTGSCFHGAGDYDDSCGDLHNALGLAGTVLLMLESEAALLCAAMWSAQAAAARRRSAVASDVAPRLQLVKQVYAAGRLGEADFDAFRGRAGPFADGSHATLARRRTAGLLVALGIVSSSLLLLTAPYVLGMVRDGVACPSCTTALAGAVDGAARLAALVALALLATLAFLGWAAGFPLQRRTTRQLADDLGTLVQEEERLLALANRSPAPAVEALLSARRSR
jgi:hypothetical protein